jgi:hypothetical protein
MCYLFIYLFIEIETARGLGTVVGYTQTTVVYNFDKHSRPRQLLLFSLK